MNYAEQVMFHQMVQQTATERKAYDALLDNADTRLWFVGKQQILDAFTDIIERYVFETQVINKIADRERSNMACKKDLDEEPSRLYKAQIDLLGEVLEIRMQMSDTLKFIRQSVTLWKRYSSEEVNRMKNLSDQLISKLRDLSDVAGLLEKYEKPFYRNNRKFQ